LIYFRKLNQQVGENGKHHKTQALLHVTNDILNLVSFCIVQPYN